MDCLLSVPKHNDHHSCTKSRWELTAYVSHYHDELRPVEASGAAFKTLRCSVHGMKMSFNLPDLFMRLGHRWNRYSMLCNHALNLRHEGRTESLASYWSSFMIFMSHLPGRRTGTPRLQAFMRAMKSESCREGPGLQFTRCGRQPSQTAEVWYERL